VDGKLVSTPQIFCEKGFPREWIWMSWAFQLALLVQTPGILKKKKNKFPVPCPFALHANPLDCRARFKHTRLGSFFEGFV